MMLQVYVAGALSLAVAAPAIASDKDKDLQLSLVASANREKTYQAILTTLPEVKFITSSANKTDGLIVASRRHGTSASAGHNTTFTITLADGGTEAAPRTSVTLVATPIGVTKGIARRDIKEFKEALAKKVSIQELDAPTKD